MKLVIHCQIKNFKFNQVVWENIKIYANGNNLAQTLIVNKQLLNSTNMIATRNEPKILSTLHLKTKTVQLQLQKVKGTVIEKYVRRTFRPVDYDK